MAEPFELDRDTEARVHNTPKSVRRLMAKIFGQRTDTVEEDDE